MGKQDKVVDLEMGEDGAYTPGKKSKTKEVVKGKQTKFKEQVKYSLPSEANEFLAGVDVGLDLVEAIKIRAARIMGIRD
jgi:hypothetical protein